jgi:hypothetical protein
MIANADIDCDPDSDSDIEAYSRPTANCRVTHISPER